MNNALKNEVAGAADSSVLENPVQLSSSETLISSELMHLRLPTCDESSTVGQCLPPSCSSSAPVGGNNQDLITQVLLFLPAKSLMRFQCDSKSWLSIISSSNFRRLHSRKNPGAEAGLVMLRKIEGKCKLYHVPLYNKDLNFSRYEHFSFSHLFDVEGEIFGMHSCQGLFCIDFLPANGSKRFYVFNPVTNQCKRIPFVDTINWSTFEIVAVNICYDPLEYEHFSLICVRKGKNKAREGRRPEFLFAVYSFQNGVWKNCEECNYHPSGWMYCHFPEGVFWKGIQFWCNEMDVLYYDFKHDYGQQAWDDDHVETGHGGYVLYFGKSEGNIWLIYSTHDGQLEVSQLEVAVDISQYCSHFARWLAKYHLDLGVLRAFGPLIVSPPKSPKSIYDEDYRARQWFGFRIRDFVADERGQEARLVISVPGKVICYNIEDKTVEELVHIEPADLTEFELNLPSLTFNHAYKLIEMLVIDLSTDLLAGLQASHVSH